jgi:outer membrane receptor protein involved in Fe transport
MNRISSRLGRVAALIIWGGTASLVAQGTQTASINGEVVDVSGNSVAGVVVRLSSPSLQGVKTITTDANGKFIVRLLPPGSYSIELIKEGFDTRKISSVLGIDQNFTPRVTLSKSGGVVVEIVASTPAADKTDIKSATNYRSDVVDRLPNGRTMEAVALLTPGVVNGVNGISIRGSLSSSNLYLLDGQNIADNAFNTRGVNIINDSIEETQIITGAIPAEYGEVDGGVLNSITKSGSNEFSGQLRWELSNPSWNAKRPTGFASVAIVGGARVLQPNRAEVPDNRLNEERTFTVGGPIIKDKLWFFASYFKTDQSANAFITGLSYSQPNAAGAQYTTGSNEIRRQVKLTWSINQDHTLVASYLNSKTSQTNRNYSAGELAALVPQANESGFFNLALRSSLTPNLALDVKVGAKHQKLSAGGAANGQSPFFSDDTNLYYNNGIFNSADGGDNRDNQTANIKATYFWNGLGSHQTDFGLDYYQGKSKARNDQSPTGYIVEAANLDLVARTAEGSALWTFQSAVGTAKTDTLGIYVNDKWSLDNHFNFQFGFRWDKYNAHKEDGSTSASASGFSPRLGVKYDLKGDSRWVFGASAARYNAKVLETILNRVTNQGNPSEIDYAYLGPIGSQSYAFLQDPTQYGLTATGAPTPSAVITFYADPKLNVRLNPKLKAPHTDEYQISATYSFTKVMGGDGFLRLTAVNRKTSDLIDDFVGNEGTVTDPTGSVIYIRKWDNSSLAERKYKSLEFDGQFTRNAWVFGGNITWSELKGNYVGEGASSPGAGSALNNFTVQNGVRLIPEDFVSPYGYLPGHTPIRVRLNASYVNENRWGKTTWGWVYRFDSAAHYDNSRLVPRNFVNSGLSSQAGTFITQFRDNKRGDGIYQASASLDLALTHEFEIVKIANRSVNGFFKIDLRNVLNHQQQITFNTTYRNARTVGASNTFATNTWEPANGPEATASDPRTLFGQPTSGSDYGLGRTVAISAGFRF